MEHQQKAVFIERKRKDGRVKLKGGGKLDGNNVIKF